jgi:hypothetical protein
MLTGPAANDFVACRYGVRYPCTPSPHTPLFYGCPAKDRRIWGNMTLGVASSLDMKNWTVESYNIVPEMNNASATMWPAKEFAWFMPTIVRNATHFALWYYIDKNSRGVAVSSSPTGPFAIVHDCIANLQLGSDLCVPLVLVVLVLLVLVVLVVLLALILLVLLDRAAANDRHPQLLLDWVRRRHVHETQRGLQRLGARDRTRRAVHANREGRGRLRGKTRQEPHVGPGREGADSGAR